MNQTYKNSTKIAQVHGVPIYMNDLVDACLIGRLNLFLQGDTGSGKTQLARDAMNYFGAGLGDADYAQKVQEKYGVKLGEGTNLAIDATKSFPKDKTLFVLGRNDMDTRELFQQINLGKINYKPQYQPEPLINPETGAVEWYYTAFDNKREIFIPKKINHEDAKKIREKLEELAGGSERIKELTSKINTNLIVVDEMPNCVPAVRAQLFNLFDGFIEINGKAYPIGNGYSAGIATGNIGQQFTESSNELGRALKDRMHVIVDTDYFFPKSSDTLEILAGNTNPRVEFADQKEGILEDIVSSHKNLIQKPVYLDKLIVSNYLLHGLDYCMAGGKEESKRKMKARWPNDVDSHGQGSDEALVLPVSIRAAKSIIRLSQALDEIAIQKGATPKDIEDGSFNSMMQAYKLVSAYSGVLNEAAVQNNYHGNHYEAIDAVIETTTRQFDDQKKQDIRAGLKMAESGKLNEKVMNLFTGRWNFMRDTLENLAKNYNEKQEQHKERQ